VFGVAALAFVFLLAAFFLSAIYLTCRCESDNYRSPGYPYPEKSTPFRKLVRVGKPRPAPPVTEV